MRYFQFFRIWMATYLTTIGLLQREGKADFGFLRVDLGEEEE